MSVSEAIAGPVVGALLRVAVILVADRVVIGLGLRLIDRLPVNARRDAAQQDSRRAATIRGLLKSALRFTVHVIVVVVVLETLGIRTSSLLAGAGLVGLVVGLGAQNLIRDVLAGLFIVYEDQFSVGDHVTLAGISGIVEEMGLRVTAVRDFGGQVHFVPYGMADKATNHSRGPMRALVEVPVDFGEAPGRVLEVLAEACDRVAESSADIVEAPRVLGITALEGQRVVYTIVGKAEPMAQWALERDIRKAVSEAFQRSGIRPPEPLGDALRPGPRGDGGSSWTGSGSGTS